MKKAGAIWEKVSKAQEQYFSISVTIEGKTHKLVAFRNTNKRSPSSPDWNVYLKQEPNTILEEF